MPDAALVGDGCFRPAPDVLLEIVPTSVRNLDAFAPRCDASLFVLEDGVVDPKEKNETARILQRHRVADDETPVADDGAFCES